MENKRSGEEIRALRERKGLGVDRVAEILHISPRTIQRIEQGKDCKNSIFFMLLKLYGAGATDLSRILGIESPPQIPVEASAAYDRSDAHHSRLSMYADMTYHCYYVSTKENNDNICSLEIKTNALTGEGYLSCTASFDGYTYECKLVSPPDSDYTFIYLTSKGSLKDRGMIILPHNRKIKTKLKTAIGKMLSLSMDLKAMPCYQKVFLLSDEYERPCREFIDRIKDEYLKITSSEPEAVVKDLYKISGADLLVQSSAVKKIVKAKLKSVTIKQV